MGHSLGVFNEYEYELKNKTIVLEANNRKLKKLIHTKIKCLQEVFIYIYIYVST